MHFSSARWRRRLRSPASLAAPLALALAGVPQAASSAQTEDPSHPVINQPDEADPSASGEDGASWPLGSPQMNGQSQDDMVLALAQPGVVSECLPDNLKSVIGTIERRWGGVTVISTHRPGARVRGSGRPSRHATCNAIDFRPAGGTYREVTAWLKSTHEGGVGTYSGRHNHIHIDNGPRYRWHN